MIYPLSYILEIEDEGNEDPSEKNDSDSIEKNNSDVNSENGILSDEDFEVIKDNNLLNVLDKENNIFNDFRINIQNYINNVNYFEF